MAPISSKQRSALPPSAFAIPSRRAYPMPTQAQARRAGISETQRLNLHRNALARSSSSKTGGSYSKMAQVARTRTGGKIPTVSRSKGTVSSPGVRKGGGSSRSSRSRR